MNRARPQKSRSQARQKPSATPATGTFLSGRRLIAVLSAALAAVTIDLYSPVLSHLFVLWDDHDYVTGNPYIRHGLNWSTIKWAFTTTYAANWHPLTWLSHALDVQFFGFDPAGHHFDNVLIHAANAVLIFLLLNWVTRRKAPSLFVAALFALHPLNVESVAWAAERKNLLCTLFFLLAIAAYVRYAQKPDWRRYLLVAFLFAAALMAKPMVITLPFVLLLLDYWPLGRVAGVSSSLSSIGAPQFATRRLWLEKTPMFVLSAVSSWITLRAQGTAFHTSEFPFSIRAENALVACVLYLWKMLWPARLAVLYPHSTSSLPAWQVILSAVVLLTITALVLIFRRRRYLPVGWFWFLGTLVPVIGLVQVGEQAMADRYAYIPLIGVFVMIAWTLDDWAEARNLRIAWRALPALCVLAVLAIVTVRQLSYWRSEYAIWAHTAAVTGSNPIAQTSLGAALRNPDVAMSPDDTEILDTEQKRLDEARHHYEEGVSAYRQLAQQNPSRYLRDLAAALADLAGAARLLEQNDEARRYYEESLQDYLQLERQHPGQYLDFLAVLLNYLGSIDVAENHLDAARQHYEEALHYYRELDKRSPGLHRQDAVDIMMELADMDKDADKDKALQKPNKPAAPSRKF
jgi:exonuclease VII small subunit